MKIDGLSKKLGASVNTEKKDFSILFDKMAEYQTDSLIVEIEGLDVSSRELDEINALREIVESTMKKEQFHFTLTS